MPAFDLLISGGTVIDGTGTPGRRVDVGVIGDRIAAVGDLSIVDRGTVGLVLDADGQIVAPGFIDPHGHSDGSVLLDGALASHLHQGYTTQLSGNCGETLAPLTDLGRDMVELALRPHGIIPSWQTFGEYLDRVEEEPLGPNVCFLVGHGTVRGAVLGSDDRAPDARELAAMQTEVAAALDVCRAYGVPLTVRGAGTSVAGNAIGTGVVLDLSRHLDRLLDLDPQARTAVVQPGVVAGPLLNPEGHA